jgi:hypothetical protein
MDDTDSINDVRVQGDFKGYSFSKYKKTDVKKELLKNMADEKLEFACNWAAELVCSGHFADLWEVILLFMSRNIHVANPKLPIYLNRRFQSFREIVGGGYVGQEIRLRNNLTVRRMFAEIMCILCFSKKNHRFEPVKISRKQDFDMTQLSRKLKAPDLSYGAEVMEEEDMRELGVVVNDLAYSVKSCDPLTSCYWVEWILEFECACKANKETASCARRTFAAVDPKYQREPVWIIWDVIIRRSKEESQLHSTIVENLFQLFCLKYTPGVIKKRRFLIYFGINILTSPWDKEQSLVGNAPGVAAVLDKCNLVYRQVKKHEQSPNTDYLFANSKLSNTDRTAQRLEIMNKLSSVPEIQE